MQRDRRLQDQGGADVPRGRRHTVPERHLRRRRLLRPGLHRVMRILQRQHPWNLQLRHRCPEVGALRLRRNGPVRGHVQRLEGHLQHAGQRDDLPAAELQRFNGDEPGGLRWPGQLPCPIDFCLQSVPVRHGIVPDDLLEQQSMRFGGRVHRRFLRAMPGRPVGLRECLREPSDGRKPLRELYNRLHQWSLPEQQLRAVHPAIPLSLRLSGLQLDHAHVRVSTEGHL